MLILIYGPQLELADPSLGRLAASSHHPHPRGEPKQSHSPHQCIVPDHETKVIASNREIRIKGDFLLYFMRLLNNKFESTSFAQNSFFATPPMAVERRRWWRITLLNKFNQCLGDKITLSSSFSNSNVRIGLQGTTICRQGRTKGGTHLYR